MSFTLADLDASRARAFAKGHGQAAPLSAAEQILHAKAQAVLERLDKAKRGGDPIAIAQAKLAAERVQSELQRTNSSRGSLEEMRSALSRSMTKMTVS
jgi:hypothetical protein